MQEEVLRMERVTRTKNGMKKLIDFQLQIYKGEIMGLIPLNAHGMNTFLELLQTNLPIDRGYIFYGEKLVNSWKDSGKTSNRITVIKTQSSLVEGMTVLENIFVLRQSFRQRIVRNKILKKQLQPFLDDIGSEISPDTYVENLSMFERIIIEILRAVILGHQLIVLKEISTLVSEKEMISLHKIIKKYAAKGFSFIYISAHHEEIAMVCDRAALLSNGRIQKVLRGKEISLETIYGYCLEFDSLVRKHLQGEHPKNSFPEKKTVSLKDVSYGSLQKMNLEVCQGECAVIQYMDEKNFHDFIRIITGESSCQSGELLIDGEKLEFGGNYNTAVIQEYPTSSMIFRELDYMNNLCLGMDRRIRNIWRNRHMKESIRKELGDTLGEEVFYMSMDELSQSQKYQLVYTRVLLQHPKVVFCIHPFIGADMSHRMYIWKLLEMLLKKGITVVILTMYLSDSISLADRLIRIGSGGKTEEVSREQFGDLEESVPWQKFYQEWYE